MLLGFGALPSAAWAGELRHPLLTGDARAAQAAMDAGASAESALVEVVVFEGARGDEGGGVTFSAGSRARIATRPAGADAVPDAIAEPGPMFLDAELAALLTGPYALSADEVDIELGVWAPEMDQVPHFGTTLAVGILEGRVTTDLDELAVRDEVAAAKRDAAATAVEAAVAEITRLGGVVRSVAYASGTLAATVPEASLPAVARLPEVESLTFASRGTDDESYYWVAPYGWSVGESLTGDEVSELIQSRQFYRATTGPYEGYGEEVGLTETHGGEVYDAHHGLTTTSGAHRVLNCEVTGWPSWTCVYIHPAPGWNHATGVTSILAGDVTDGQDPLYTTDTDQRNHSGVARDATVMGVNQHVNDSENLFTSGFFEGWLVNHASSPDGTDPQCTGRSTWARSVDTVYETGIAWFKSAGNNGFAVETDCTLGGPAAAIGVFPVGAYVVREDGSLDPWANTSRGGTPSEGRGRTHIALSAPTLLENPYLGDPIGSLYDPTPFGGTSAATPVVAGAAAVFRDWYGSTYGAFINDPGVLYTMMLLMGDRANQYGGVGDGFDNLTGAGHLRLRMFDTVGLDNPMGWEVGTVCVGQQESVTLDIGGGPEALVPALVDVVRIVAWWYDRRFDNSLAPHDHDKIDLQLLVGGNTYDATSEDNRQRLQVAAGVGGSTVRATLVGRDVTADDEGCGANRMKVYYAWFYEQSDHNDLDVDLDGAPVLDQVRPEG